MLSANAKALRSLGKALREADAAMYREVQRSLRVVGQEVAARAKANASYSTRIPGSVTVRTSGVNAVVVSAKSPNAGPVENHGKGYVRHPVFGDRNTWTDKNSHPAFLVPAATERLQENAEAVADALKVQVEQTIHGQEGFF